MRRWKHRCAKCGHPRHFWPFYVRGWLVWHLLVRWAPVRWLPVPIIALVGDYAYDHRGCRHAHGPEAFEDDFEWERRAMAKEGRHD